MINDTPNALQKIYEMTDISRSLELYSGPIKLNDGANDLCSDEGKIFFEWFPRPHIELSLNEYSNQSSNGNQYLELTQEDIKIVEKSTQLIKGLALKRINNNSPQDLSYVLFHLTNFRNCHGSFIKSIIEEQETQYSGRTILKDESWKVTLDAQKNTRDDENRLNLLGGYSITHVGKIEKSNGSTFTVEQVDDLLSSLHYFFSFARSRWSSPILPVGFNQQNQQIWKPWEAPVIDSWQYTTSWFNLTSDSLSQLFPGFMNRWSNSTWNEPIKITIHWYISSKNGYDRGIEGAIALAQIALELLSSMVIAEEKKILSVDELSNRNASAQFRLLLSTLGISLSIPSNLSDLTTVASLLPKTSEGEGPEGPEVLTYIRNRIIHAKVKNIQSLQNLPPLARVQAWRLSSKYISLILLQIFDYQGKYLNWIENPYATGEEGEVVPWAS